MHSPLLSILYVFGAALISATLLVRLKQPNIIGYLIAGLLIGPYGLGLIPYKDVELLSEVGIGLLMFTIGLELSVPALLRVKGISVIGGSLQLAVTVGICFLLAPLLNWSSSEAAIWGLCLSLSSTVVVLKLLGERGEIGSTQGNISTGILLFQDVIAIPILLLIPFLQNQSSDGASETPLVMIIGQLLAFAVLIYVLGRFLIPKFLRFVAHTHSKELFSISIFSITLAVAAISHQAGLSLALGAFIAGLIVSESDFGNQAASEVLPLKDAFGAVFFVSVGMLLDFQNLVDKWPLYTVGLSLILLLKFLVALAICFLFRYQSQISVFVAMILAQIGEFGFLVLLVAKKHDLIREGSYQRILGISILSIVATPYFLKLYPRVKRLFAFMNKTSWIHRIHAPEETKEDAGKYSGHVLICGYGPTGQKVAKELQSQGYATVIVDLNYRVIQQLKAMKQNAVYGDSSSMIVLEAAGIHAASMLVVTIPDPLAMRSLVRKVKAAHPDLPLLFRVKYMSDRDKLLALGATDVVWEEEEAGKELCKRAAAILNVEPLPVN